MLLHQLNLISVDLTVRQLPLPNLQSGYVLTQCVHHSLCFGIGLQLRPLQFHHADSQYSLLAHVTFGSLQMDHLTQF